MSSSPDQSVEVVAYRDDWPARFDAEQARLTEALGDTVTLIEHIGSTAVPGMASKPTLDILVVADDLGAVLRRLPLLEGLGYDYRPGNTFVGHEEHLFLRKVVDGKRTHHLHVLRTGSSEIDDYRLFRDALRGDVELARRYQRLKLDLAAEHAQERMRYVTEKEAWVGEVLTGLRRAAGLGAGEKAVSPQGTSAGRGAIYDRIGGGYAGQRVPEPTWVDQIGAALSGAGTLVNVGAGTGNYEPTDRTVVAVEPSATMIAQRSGANPVVQGVAENLPFADGTFDAALATFTVHHWSNRARGLAEMRRVATQQVLVVYEPLVAHQFWLIDYFPEAAAGVTEADAPTPEEIGRHLDVIDVQTMWIPADCSDGVAAAYWRRPEAYLEPAVQQSMSILALLGDHVIAAGADRLRTDLADGTWDERYGHLRRQHRADYGYRLVIAGH